MSDLINHPSHYAMLEPEPINVIEGWGLNYRLGNVLKYIARHRNKGATIQDLQKARWYLDREISALQMAENKAQAPTVVNGDKCPPGGVRHTHSWNVPLAADRPLGDDYTGPK
jgi:uncharacterized protein DUF3310